MQIATILIRYGYAALFIGTFLEGETVLVLGGLAAHQGYLQLAGVIWAGLAGSFAADQLFFYLGRRHSKAILTRFHRWKGHIERAQGYVQRHETLIMLLFRFLYGLRSATPFVLGMSKVRTIKFIFLSAAGAVVWSIAIGAGGYFFGRALKLLIGEVKRYEGLVLLSVLVVGGGIWLLHFRRR